MEKNNALNPQNEMDSVADVQPLAETEAAEVSEVVEQPTEETQAQTEVPAHAARPAAPAVTKLGAELEDDNDLITASMPGFDQKAEIDKMDRAIRSKMVCYGRVIGVEIFNRTEVRIVVKRETLRVIIPADDFFYYSTMKDLDKATPEEKLLRYRRKAAHMLTPPGAVVSFLPKAMGKDDAGIPFVVASRKESMERLQNKYFFSAKAKAEVGSVAKASILSVGPRYVTVECLGVEAVIGTGGLSAFTYIDDASKEFHVGDGLMVAIAKLDVDRANRKIDIVFSHALVEQLEAKVERVNDRLLGGRYAATVVAVLQKYYVVIINGLKIRGLVPKNGGYFGEDPLLVGDNVVMLVTGVNEEKNLAIGRCLRAN